jgi:hypothetical protein
MRSIIRLTLGFDHRIIDGADTSRFMADEKSGRSENSGRVRTGALGSPKRTWAEKDGAKPLERLGAFSYPLINPL